MNRAHNHSTPTLSILVADDDAAARTSLMLALEHDGHHVFGAGNVYDALAEASWRTFDLVFAAATAAAADALQRVREECPECRVVLMGASASTNSTGDYLNKPVSAAQAQAVARRVAESRLISRHVAVMQRTLNGL